MVRDGPLENLSGAGAKYKKDIFAQGKIKWKKIHARHEPITPINPKKYSCYGLKKHSYKEFDGEKKFLRLDNSPPRPPITFLMVH